MYYDNPIPSENENRFSELLDKGPEDSGTIDMESVEMGDFIAAWEITGTSFSYSAANPDRAWANLHVKINKSDMGLKKRALKPYLFRAAAMAVLAAGIGFATYKAIQTPGGKLDVPIKTIIAETVAHPSNLKAITLPDGSVVKLNARTKLEYPEVFGPAGRKVKLSGEAFFEVAKDVAHPFIIDTGNALVEVLGTSFNVSAYPGSGLVEVNVETGKVKLTRNKNGEPASHSAILPAGQHGWLKVANGAIGQTAVLSQNYSAWVTKKISFQRTPLAEAFSTLENTYHVPIKMEGPEIGTLSYTANFADQPLDYIIAVIARTHRLNVTRDSEGFIFSTIKN